MISGCAYEFRSFYYFLVSSLSPSPSRTRSFVVNLDVTEDNEDVEVNVTEDDEDDVEDVAKVNVAEDDGED